MSVKPNKNFVHFILVPLIFLTAALLGGLRLSAENNAFIFLKPSLICLIFAAILFILFFRANVIRFADWFSYDFLLLKNFSNGIILLSLFAASTQIFNSLLPEKGLAFWIVGFFFFWTLWNNLFVDFKAKRLLQNLGSLFGLAFIVKYLLLANLVGQGEATWTQKIVETVTKEFTFGLLDLPKFSAVTGYVQFFTLILYSGGLILLSSESPETADSPTAVSEITS